MSANNEEILLKVEHLKKAFDDHVVLKDINTTVKKGDVIAIILRFQQKVTFYLKVLISLIKK